MDQEKILRQEDSEIRQRKVQQWLLCPVVPLMKYLLYIGLLEPYHDPETEEKGIDWKYRA